MYEHDADDPVDDVIRGVFSTREAAMDFIGEIMKNESLSIEEMRSTYIVVTEELNPTYVLLEGRY